MATRETYTQSTQFIYFLEGVIDSYRGSQAEDIQLTAQSSQGEDSGRYWDACTPQIRSFFLEEALLLLQNRSIRQSPVNIH